MIPIRDTVSSRSLPLVNWALIAANVAVFLWLAGQGRAAESIFEAHGTVPRRFLAGLSPNEVGTLFSSMFLHVGWAHLFSNMLALYIFGDNVEDRLGRPRFLFLYVACGLISAMVHIIFNPGSAVATIGASGAISGVLAAYFLFFPTARVVTLVLLLFWPFFVEIPAVLYLGFWFVSQLFSGLLSVSAADADLGGIAWWAHVAGFVAGLVLGPALAIGGSGRRTHTD